MAENVKFTIIKPETMKSHIYVRLMRKLVKILEKLDVGVKIKKVKI
jgi:hypothetical protein|tara:strand:- start:407 stop:544 length:138 start_codon:yes stop_codon:yes gene_type:complete